MMPSVVTMRAHVQVHTQTGSPWSATAAWWPWGIRRATWGCLLIVVGRCHGHLMDILEIFNDFK